MIHHPGYSWINNYYWNHPPNTVVPRCLLFRRSYDPGMIKQYLATLAIRPLSIEANTSKHIDSWRPNTHVVFIVCLRIKHIYKYILCMYMYIYIYILNVYIYICMYILCICMCIYEYIDEHPAWCDKQLALGSFLYDYDWFWMCIET